jgi:hypothetical protein
MHQNCRKHVNTGLRRSERVLPKRASGTPGRNVSSARITGGAIRPFLEDGLIRIRGRLQYADLPRMQIHPILLHGSHHFTVLLIRQTHLRLHHLGVRIVLAELRDEFWILPARQPRESYTRVFPVRSLRTPSVGNGRPLSPRSE